ncbi:hypothetical protein NDR87_31670 [Nocardia sp. CDC159]|uniref:Uncharacterized protein n=1 Tax=Nocardia pulmonis TaxID=2951408 RepID=A0A9X2ECL2_9NOCA|nr:MULTISPECIES: hypothetical protein [Nocardia]MCM6777891.1 hypothetical protein [Nocardia pulmonis]MCM6790938.1 hypothetical protein [Nocardia sp. CDC159]
MTDIDTSIVYPWRVNSMWGWIVVPRTCTDIYIPAPSRAAAEWIAHEFNRSRPAEYTRYIHFRVTDAMRSHLRLPKSQMPDIPDLPGYRSWAPASKDAYDRACATGRAAALQVVLKQPGDDKPRRLYLTAAPLIAKKTA